MKFCYVMPKTRVQEVIFNNLFFRKHLFYDYNQEDQAGNLFLGSITDSGFYMNRDSAEKDEMYVQIIPAFVISAPGKFLLYQRKSKHTEKRLAGKWTCLFGGHIDPDDFYAKEKTADFINTDVVLPIMVNNSLVREMSEETGIDIQDAAAIDLKGFLYDPRDSVGRVHLGIVFEVCLNLSDNDEIALLEQIKSKPEVADVVFIEKEDKNALKKYELEGWATVAIDVI